MAGVVDELAVDYSSNTNEWATTWVSVSTAQDDGKVQVDDGTATPPTDIDQLALPGHYSKPLPGWDGYMLRLERGGVIVAAYTAPPSDAADGEVGWIGPDTTSPMIARVTPGALGDLYEIKGGRIMDTVILCSDGATKYVGRDLDPVVTPAGVSVGTIRATTIKVKAG